MKTCIKCGNSFDRDPHKSLSLWSKQKYCSSKCFYASVSKRVLKQCKYCSSEFETGGRAGDSGQNFCSVKCNNIHRNKLGILGKKIDGSGYLAIYKPSHKKANRGYVPEHRLVAEAVLGRLLKDDEMVHHLDCNKQNNDPNNLFVCTKSVHQILHSQMSEAYARYVYGDGFLHHPDMSNGILLSDLYISPDLESQIQPDVVE